MEVKKILRKATAVAASASFIGATMLGAIAQDLAKYPAPFVNNGMFDAFIVVGQDAQPMDVVGAVDVGASLQFALKKAASVSDGTADATIDTGYKVQKSGNKFNYGDSVNEIQDATAIAAEDLPAVLADGKYVESEGNTKNSVTYTQKLDFTQTTTPELQFAQDDDLAKTAGDYLYIKKNTELYQYTLQFDSDVEYDNSTETLANDDLKTSVLTIQGRPYTITDVQLASGKIDQLTLLAGEAVLWLTQNNPITKTVSGVEHTVEVLDVTEDADACQVKVDDVTAIVNKDATKVINGVQVGITDVRAIHAQLQDVDVCQISVGASELLIKDGDNVKVDDVEVDGTTGNIEDLGGKLQEISVDYSPKDQDDDIYLAGGKEFIDPVFKSWKIAYGGLTAEYEKYELKTSGDKDAKFTFINNDAKEIELPMYYNGSTVKLASGDNADDQFLANSTNGKLSYNSNICAPTSLDVEDCEGVSVIGVTSGGETHIFTINNIDTAKNETDLKDETYGRTHDNVAFKLGINSALDLGSFGTFNVTITTANLTVLQTAKGKIETNNKASIDILKASGNQNVSFAISESNRNSNNTIPDELSASTFTLNAIPDNGADTEVDVTASGGTYDVAVEEDSDYDVLVSLVGTKVTVDSQNQNSVVVEMPKAEVYGNVFVAPIVATLGAGSSSSTYTLSKLNVGAAKLDSEISSASADNLIVIGGPCANKVAAQVLGVTYPACGEASGIAQDTGMIKAVAQSSGKVALVVAGWEAIDTRRATRVLANYDQYALSGAMVTVTGTSLTDIQVKKSA